jgi:hypothetical protein
MAQPQLLLQHTSTIATISRPSKELLVPCASCVQLPLAVGLYSAEFCVASQWA